MKVHRTIPIVSIIARAHSLLAATGNQALLEQEFHELARRKRKGDPSLTLDVTFIEKDVINPAKNSDDSITIRCAYSDSASGKSLLVHLHSTTGSRYER